MTGARCLVIGAAAPTTNVECPVIEADTPTTNVRGSVTGVGGPVVGDTVLATSVVV